MPDSMLGNENIRTTNLTFQSLEISEFNEKRRTTQPLKIIKQNKIIKPYKQ